MLYLNIFSSSPISIKVEAEFLSALGFPGGSHDKESACNSGDLNSIPGLGRSPGGGNGNSL